MNRLSARVVIVGGGPACVSAAIQLIRSNIDILLVTKEIGGSVRNANLIENLVGFPGGISGDAYVALMQSQIEGFKIPVLRTTVLSIQKGDNDHGLLIKSESHEILATHVIVGLGTQPKKMGLTGEEPAFQKKQLFYEYFNTRPFVFGKKILVIGGGDIAYDYALNLSETAQKITILQRSAVAKSLPLLQTRVKTNSNINLISQIRPIEIQSSENGVNLICESDQGNMTYESDLILIAIGRTPNTLVINLSEDDFSVRKRLFYVGDMKNGIFRQISIAIGDGMKAAMDIIFAIGLEKSPIEK